MLAGSCLCGAIRYEVQGDLGEIVLCHCRQCRKAQGGAFGANAPVAASSLRFVAGESLLTSFESSPGKIRAFCSRCGSPVLSRRADRPDVVRLRIGLLDTPIAQRPACHIYVGSKAEWLEVDDDLPQYQTREPGRA
jgi:hypothetical protein